MAELSDMRLFVLAISHGSLSAAGRVLGLSPAVCSKRLTRLESDLGARLLQRSSRQLALTEEGARYLEHCRAILLQIDEAEAEIGGRHGEPRGVLRVSAPSALGRRWIGPAVARYAARYPQVTVNLSLSDSVVDLLDGGFDCAIRIGQTADSALIARTLAPNRRVLCAAPAYLAQRGFPATPADLMAHDCILMQRQPAMHADWRLHRLGDPAERSNVRINGRLATDNGEQANDWAVAGLGIVRRSIWDVADELAQGRLIQVLPDWTGDDAPIQIVYPSRRHLPARTRVFIDLLVAVFDEAKRHNPALCAGASS